LVSRWGPSREQPDHTSPTSDKEICIITTHYCITYPFTHVVFKEPKDTDNIKEDYLLTPDVLFYSSQVDYRRPVMSFFDNSYLKLTGASNISFSLISQDEHSVHLRRFDNASKSSCDAWFSLDFDGNPTRFTTEGGPTKIDLKCTWSRDRKGNVYLQKMERVRRVKSRNGISNLYDLYEISDFDPTFKPPRDSFEIQSLPLEKGVTVRDKVAGRTYRLGDPAVSDVSESLNRLVETMRSRGFATKSR
jgi:hypothetical protein